MYFIRTASSRDVAVIRELLVETWHATYDDIYGEKRVSQITSDWHSIEQLEANLTRPNSEFVVADDGQSIAGVAYASSQDKAVQLHQLYVLPVHHGTKVGLHLLVEIENAFPHCNRIWLEVEERNVRAVAFYERYGFRQVGRTANCGAESSGIPALIMEKPIAWAED